MLLVLLSFFSNAKSVIIFNLFEDAIYFDKKIEPFECTNLRKLRSLNCFGLPD